MYIALGDSLSAGVGASDPGTTAFVPLIDEGLGPDIELMNLGHSGDTSRDLLEHGHLDEAVATITERNGDADPANDVVLVTLEIGGNDLLDLLFDLVATGKCPTLQESLETPECVDKLESAIEGVAPNLHEALARLQEADPEVTIALLTLPNPFSGGIITIDQLGEMAIEGRLDTPFPEGVNDTIRAAAGDTGVLLVDVYPLFEGKAGEYISRDFIHPNDTGYRVMADAVLEALGG